MKIRYKLLAGLLGVPFIFAIVAVLLIITNRQVKRNSTEGAFATELGIDAAKLLEALITGQKAAEELMAEKLRALQEPGEREAAEASARRSEEMIKLSQANIEDALTSLVGLTQLGLEEARKRGTPAEADDEAEELKKLQEIRARTGDHLILLNKYVSIAHSNVDKADEVLNLEVEPDYEQTLLPLVQNYVAARDEEAKIRSLQIDQSVARITRLVAGSAIGSVMLALLIALVLSRPLKNLAAAATELAAAATEIGKGDLEWRIQVKSRDEIGVVARAFNLMAENIKLADMTKAKLETQLRQSQKMEAIGTLAGGVAHDFNNLLTVIGGNSELALTRLAADSPVRERVLEIKKAADRAAALTRQLLAFGRQQQLQRKAIDLNGTIRETLKLLIRVIGADVQVHLNSAEDLSAVFADASQIEQIIMNLAINARDAMPHGGQLLIETDHIILDRSYLIKHPEAKPGRYAEIKLSDSGTGMDQDTMARVFEPFFTTKEVGKGTGLGLAMVYGIVKQHEGSIDVYSELGHGTTFKIYLPLADQINPEVAAEVCRHFAGGKETILVADDEEPLRELARSVLEDLGYTVLLARNGEEAVRIFATHEERIELVVLDVVMPGMGGHEACEIIRKSDTEVPVIFMTGYSAEMVRGKYRDHAELPFIQKPYSNETLGRAVRDALDGLPKALPMMLPMNAEVLGAEAQ